MRRALFCSLIFLGCGRANPNDGPRADAQTQAAEPATKEADKPAPEEPENLEPGDKTVLVELYSSQGCNSCPEADALIGKLPEFGWTKDKVIPLTFHVTYWDDLGWTDPYGSQVHDQRQISYAQTVPGARADDENTIKGPYTPQMVVDGRIHFSGTLKDVANREITKASNARQVIELSASASVTSGDTGEAIRVDVKSSAVQDSGLDTDKSKIGLFAAVTQKQVQTEVPRGENAGKKLDEYWVVRQFAGPKLFRSSRHNETQFDLALPGDAKPEDLDVVVFAQDLATLGIYTVTAVPLGTSAVATAAGME
jgi:hypothetical protein